VKLSLRKFLSTSVRGEVIFAIAANSGTKMSLNRKILLGIGAVVLALSFTGKTFAQQPTPAVTDLPVHTYYKDYRLEGVVLDNSDSDPASASNNPSSASVSSVAAVPEPTTATFLVVAALGAGISLLRKSRGAR
jgi:hypothetical protein